ncbi:class I SAM-dependent methyltransferase [Acinetobacter larvae]|uniref:Ribosomal RNA small subunit methyltransferase J n=1 Tax=Acinetobacter larvae TaxID=1789224 RepID=A0A1B2LWM6_9GAMM|nr:class I SAM-dependent methyltransferase [Acinetobacter larvae]AOA57341.1 rRNA methyltransferase [Acinetobacter larvae]
MVSAWRLYSTAADAVAAQLYQQRLRSRGVQVEWLEVEQLNARFLRQHADLALCCDAQGLWLCAQGMKMQPDWFAERARLKRASLKSEMIARACQLAEQPKLLDATAGLGHDALLMAQLGAEVTLLERHPILFSLLEDNQQRALQDPFLCRAAERIQLQHVDAQDYMTQSLTLGQHYDVIYLDPMFPQRDQNQQAAKKQAQVKKQMQLLHLLLQGEEGMDLGDALLPAAQQIATRVVVKRPRHAVFLANQAADHQWLGDACRFDAYFSSS